MRLFAPRRKRPGDASAADDRAAARADVAQSRARKRDVVDRVGLLLFQYSVKFDDRGKLAGDAAIAAPTAGNGGISRDGLTSSITCATNLRFADGSPLTARDCVWSIRADPKSGQQRADAVRLRPHRAAPMHPIRPRSSCISNEPFAPLADAGARAARLSDSSGARCSPPIRTSITCRSTTRPVGSGPTSCARWTARRPRRNARQSVLLAG